MKDFLQRLQEQFPGDFEEISQTFVPRPPVIRANTVAVSSDELQKLFQKEGFSLEMIPELPSAFLVLNADKKKLTALPSFLQGLFYIQSFSSQWVVQILAPKPGEKILDLCAAPGSKTTDIASRMKKQGILMANDRSRPRMFKLLANLRSQHVSDFVQVKQFPGELFPKKYPSFFDRVLVDAPCSGEARFQGDDPRSYQSWSKKASGRLSSIQKRLLFSAFECTRPGGKIVYSTCTFSREENEEVVDVVLRKYPNVSLLPIFSSVKRLPVDAPWGEKTLRIFPDQICESFFIALFEKRL